MPGDREKGKIAHSEWPKIVARYRAGETIARISRDYGCTAPAIRYIVKRTGAFHGATGGGAAGAVQKSRGGAGDPTPLGARDARSGRGGARAMVLRADLRERVSGDIASFLVALDQAMVERSPRSASELQEATDKLMRSTARVRLELERLLAGDETAVQSLGAQTVSSARSA